MINDDEEEEDWDQPLDVIDLFQFLDSGKQANLLKQQLEMN